MSEIRNFIKNKLNKLLTEQNIKNNFYVLYHGTDSDFFTELNFDESSKGERFNNPLGDALYLTPYKEDAEEFFGKNVYVYYLPKNANIKHATKENWENDFNEIVSEVFIAMGKDYDKLDRMSQNRIKMLYREPTQIKILNELTFLLSNLLKIDVHEVADIIESVMNKRNEQYDAIWYDYGEVLIPPSKFNSKLFKKTEEDF